MEGTSRRGCKGARNVSRKDNPLFSGFCIHMGSGGEKRFCVGVKKSVENIAGPSRLDNGSQIHDGDTVTHVVEYRKVVGYYEEGKGKFTLQFLEKIDYLGLD